MVANKVETLNKDRTVNKVGTVADVGNQGRADYEYKDN